ncbi:DUF485 domain-containing protein [Nocardioides sp. NPDC047086]|uniref:DUF485 domain-containing protein n=1 Tax=Nocardioides sp. NPDC047086 TaxID=3154810 RepID=UPI0033D0993C
MPFSPTPPVVDYRAVAHSAGFQNLVARRRGFVALALGLAVAWFGGFLLLTSYAHGFMQTVIAPGLTVAYVLGLSQFVLVWCLAAAYLRTSRRVFDPMQVAVAAAVSTGTTEARA